jgi:hypothetical protein
VFGGACGGAEAVPGRTEGGGVTARFVVTRFGGTAHVLDRAWCHRVVAKFESNGGAYDLRQAKALCSALNLRHGPYPVKL